MPNDSFLISCCSEAGFPIWMAHTRSLNEVFQECSLKLIWPKLISRKNKQAAEESQIGVKGSSINTFPSLRQARGCAPGNERSDHLELSTVLSFLVPVIVPLKNLIVRHLFIREKYLQGAPWNLLTTLNEMGIQRVHCWCLVSSLFLSSVLIFLYTPSKVSKSDSRNVSVSHKAQSSSNCAGYSTWSLRRASFCKEVEMGTYVKNRNCTSFQSRWRRAAGARPGGCLHLTPGREGRGLGG